MITTSRKFENSTQRKKLRELSKQEIIIENFITNIFFLFFSSVNGIEGLGKVDK